MLAIAAVLAVTGITVGSVRAFANNDRKLPIYCVETDKKQVAISLDAAWGNDDTPALIDILKKDKVPATYIDVRSRWISTPNRSKRFPTRGTRFRTTPTPIRICRSFQRSRCAMSFKAVTKKSRQSQASVPRSTDRPTETTITRLSKLTKALICIQFNGQLTALTGKKMPPPTVSAKG